MPARPPTPRRRPAAPTVASIAAALALAGCAATPSKEEQEAAKNAFACQLDGERIVLRFDADEVRMLMPDGARIVLYQIPAASGVRYTNGTIEVRGKGADLQMARHGVTKSLEGCAPLAPPPK